MPFNPTRRMLKGRSFLHDPIDFNYRVEEWTLDGKKVVQVVAGADSVTVARAAFDAVVKQEPNSRITIRQGTRVVAEYLPEQQKD